MSEHAALQLESAMPKWFIIDNASASVRPGGEINQEKDSSWLVEWDPAPSQRIKLQFNSPLPKVAAIRLEAIPHDRIINGGAGWASNFHLTEARLGVRQANHTVTPLKFHSAAADFVRRLDNATVVQDGPWALWDKNSNTRWDIEGEYRNVTRSCSDWKSHGNLKNRIGFGS